MKSKKLWIPVAILCIIVVTVMIFVFKSCDTFQSKSAGMVLDADAVYYEPNSALTYTDNGISVPGYSTVYFAEGDRVVPLTLYNPKENDCLFKFELYIDDSDLLIAETDLIKPGMATEFVELNQSLKAGEYTLKIKVCTYTEEELNPLNNAVVTAKLSVI